MAVFVIDLLEKIDVNGEYAHRMIVALEAIHLVDHGFFEASPVPGSCQLVGAGQAIQFDQRFPQLLVDLL